MPHWCLSHLVYSRPSKSYALVSGQAANDGGRDFSSKITTLPSFPKFLRFIPSYLDHSASITDMDIEEISQSIRIVDITEKEILEEMLEMFDSMNEAPLDEASETFNEEEADLQASPSQRAASTGHTQDTTSVRH